MSRPASLAPSVLAETISRWTLSALLARVAVAVTGALTAVAVDQSHRQLVALLALGVLLAVANPARAGAGVAVATALWGWLADDVTHPSVVRTCAFAAVLYLLHSATALAAAVPLTARLHPGVVRDWARRAGWHLGIAGILAAAVYGVSSISLPSSVEIAGLAGAVVVLAVVAVLFGPTRPPG